MQKYIHIKIYCSHSKNATKIIITKSRCSLALCWRHFKALVDLLAHSGHSALLKEFNFIFCFWILRDSRAIYFIYFLFFPLLCVFFCFCCCHINCYLITWVYSNFLLLLTHLSFLIDNRKEIFKNFRLNKKKHKKNFTYTFIRIAQHCIAISRV